MSKLTEEQIKSNWDKLIQVIKDTFEDGSERRENLLKMYHYFEDRMCIAPASGKEHYHNAYVGGYVEHVLHVIDCAVQLKEVWEKNGAMINFTDEELIFAAMHHDLGKVGDLNHDYYIPNDSDWHRKNQGMIFTHNPKLQYMTVTDRAIFLLNHFGVKYSEWEYIGLRLTDGLYEEANKNYLKTYIPDWQLKSNIAYILHQADLMATHIEYDQWKNGEKKKDIQVKEHAKVSVSKPKEKDKVDEVLQKRSTDLFDELFGDKS